MWKRKATHQTHLWMLWAAALIISLQVLIAREQSHASAAPQKLLLRSVAKLRLEIPAVIVNALDEHRIRRDDERDSDAALESGHPQSWQQVIALCLPQWKCREPVAEIDDLLLEAEAGQAIETIRAFAKSSRH